MEERCSQPLLGAENGETKMFGMITIASAIMLLSMVKKTTKKTPIFGQLTLTGQLALDWMKNGDEIIASKIWFCSVNALVNDWNVPEWALTKGIVALIFPIDEWGNPMFITQKSVLTVLEYNCANWEAKGASVKLVGNKTQGQKSEISFAENHPAFKFSRPDGCPVYQKYTVEINGEVQ